ncbi:MAG: cytochrome P450 [Micavibrio sp.]
MLESEKFTPHYPRPHKTKLVAFWRFLYGWNSWIHTLFEKSYHNLIGYVRMRKLDFYLVNEPASVKEIMEKRHDDFPKHSIQHEILCPLLGNSIFTSNGAEWRRQREMINPAFAHTRLSLSFPTMRAAADAMMKRLGQADLSRPVSIDPLMTYITADIIFRTILSRTLDSADAYDVFENFNIYQDYTQKIITCRLYGLPSLFLKSRQGKAAKKIRAVLAPLIEERYNAYHHHGENKDDIIGSFLNARAPDTGAAFQLGELTNHVMMLFLAGHETSASALTWSLYLISRCPHLQAAMREEVNAIRDGGEITHEMLRHFKQVRNVFRESLRLYPPVGFMPREPVQDSMLRDRSIKKGSVLSVSPWLIHRHRAQWAEPDLFDPDRWDDETQQESIRCSYLPFGKGPRICVGQGFAQQEALLIIATIVSAYNLEPAQKNEPEPVSRVTLRPHKEIKLWFRPAA